jgi:hypothetical protein
MPGGTVANYIGDHAEWICMSALGRFYNRRYPYFKPILLGQKYEAVGIYVQLLGSSGEFMPYYFFVQVKGTADADRYTKRARRLKVAVSANDIRKIKLFPAPTYIIGVDQPLEHCYIASANEDCPGHFPSIPTKFLLDSSNSSDLWTEVRDFWVSNRVRLKSSRFSG